jgi:hypothetical protein
MSGLSEIFRKKLGKLRGGVPGGAGGGQEIGALGCRARVQSVFPFFFLEECGRSSVLH